MVLQKNQQFLFISTLGSTLPVFIFLTLPLVVLGFLQRCLLLYHLHARTLVSANREEIALIFGAGLRFDFMVGAYFGFFLALFGWFSRGRYLKMSFSAVLLFSALLFCWEMVFFDQVFNRWTHGYLSQTNQLFLNFGRSRGFFLSLSVQVGALVFLLLGVFWRTPSHYFKHRPIGSFLLLLLLFAISIRGSLGAHHLDLRHSEVTSKELLNQASLNTWYALDQALRGRR